MISQPCQHPHTVVVVDGVSYLLFECILCESGPPSLLHKRLNLVCLRETDALNSENPCRFIASVAALSARIVGQPHAIRSWGTAAMAKRPISRCTYIWSEYVSCIRTRPSLVYASKTSARKRVPIGRHRTTGSLLGCPSRVRRIFIS